MKKIINILPLFSLIIIFCFSIIFCAKNEIDFDTTPEDLYKKMVNNPAFEENPSGESFCWHARVGIDQYVENYLLTKNTDWLDAGIKYYDFLIGKMDTDPDGYKGWIGSFSRSGKGTGQMLLSAMQFS